MRARRQKKNGREATHYEPHCRNCGSKEVSFRYIDGVEGHELDERGALSMACMWLEKMVVRAEEPDEAAGLAYSLYELSLMQSKRPRPGEDETPEATRTAVG